MKRYKFDRNLIDRVKSQTDSIDDYIVFSSNEPQTLECLHNMGVAYCNHPFINAMTVSARFSDICKISDLHHITHISGNSDVCTLINKAKTFSQISNLTENKYFGDNVTIAFIDTGISPHMDFLYPKSRILKFVDLLHDRSLPYDDNGHGTFVTGVACGGGVADRAYRGVAHRANILSIKALDQNGETSANTILDAMQYVYDHKNKYNIKVVCMSFGAECGQTIDPLQKGAETLWNHGIAVVAAAGNSGPMAQTIKSPGANSKIITVGGLDERSDTEIKIANFSSRGPTNSRFKPDMVAPSVNLTSCNDFRDKKFYSQMSGTSVATPFVAGICAIMYQKFPTITPDRLKYYLTKHCTPIERNRNSEGFGYIHF